LHRREVKELLFMKGAPSCLPRPSLAGSAWLGVRASLRHRIEGRGVAVVGMGCHVHWIFSEEIIAQFISKIFHLKTLLC
ncbi:MAG TPA: hypothetical protein PK200_10895, partial [Spirochaetota bacterium]|nr:hypothetical protein [Spirochaetota bacterium]